MCNRVIRDDLEEWQLVEFFAFYMLLWHSTRIPGSKEEKACANAINLPCSELSTIRDASRARFPVAMGPDGLEWSIEALEEERLRPCRRLAKCWCDCLSADVCNEFKFLFPQLHEY
jgi:hypothetical protein